jgi:hypothetical protein
LSSSECLNELRLTLRTASTDPERLSLIVQLLLLCNFILTWKLTNCKFVPLRGAIDRISDRCNFNKIVDERRRHNKIQYKVRWQGEGPEGDIWLPASELEDCAALDDWQARRPKLPRVVLRY